MTYHKYICTLATSLLLAAVATAQASAVADFPRVQVQVNSPKDGPITPDDQLTLREAIAITNGTLTPAELSNAEQQQVTPNSGNSVITFDLPAGNTTIELQSLLPVLAQPGLVIDGTTQPGYDATKSATAEILVAVPVVEITPADNAEVFRGLTVVADDITIRGLSLYGFTSEHRATESTPPADIFIAHELPPPDISQQQIPASNFSFYDEIGLLKELSLSKIGSVFLLITVCLNSPPLLEYQCLTARE